MLNHVKNVLIDDDMQQKLNDLQKHFSDEAGVTYSEAAVFRRAIHQLHRSIFKSENNN